MAGDSVHKDSASDNLLAGCGVRFSTGLNSLAVRAGTGRGRPRDQGELDGKGLITPQDRQGYGLAGMILKENRA